MKDYFVRIKFPNSDDFFVSQVQLDLPPIDLSVSSLVEEGHIDNIKSAAINFKNGLTADDFEILEVKAVDDYVPYTVNIITPDGFEHTLFNISIDSTKGDDFIKQEILQTVTEGTAWLPEQIVIKHFGPSPSAQIVPHRSIEPTIAEQMALLKTQETGALALESAAIVERYGDNVTVDYELIAQFKEYLTQATPTPDNG